MPKRLSKRKSRRRSRGSKSRKYRSSDIGIHLVEATFTYTRHARRGLPLECLIELSLNVTYKGKEDPNIINGLRGPHTLTYDNIQYLPLSSRDEMIEHMVNLFVKTDRAPQKYTGAITFPVYILSSMKSFPSEKVLEVQETVGTSDSLPDKLHEMSLRLMNIMLLSLASRK